MRNTCDGCPCLRTKNKRRFCFWYSSWVDNNDGCGNSFTEEPKLSQQQLTSTLGVAAKKRPPLVFLVFRLLYRLDRSVSGACLEYRPIFWARWPFILLPAVFKNDKGWYSR